MFAAGHIRSDSDVEMEHGLSARRHLKGARPEQNPVAVPVGHIEGVGGENPAGRVGLIGEADGQGGREAAEGHSLGRGVVDAQGEAVAAALGTHTRIRLALQDGGNGWLGHHHFAPDRNAPKGRGHSSARVGECPVAVGGTGGDDEPIPRRRGKTAHFIDDQLAPHRGPSADVLVGGQNEYTKVGDRCKTADGDAQRPVCPLGIRPHNVQRARGVDGAALVAHAHVEGSAALKPPAVEGQIGVLVVALQRGTVQLKETGLLGKVIEEAHRARADLECAVVDDRHAKVEGVAAAVAPKGAVVDKGRKAVDMHIRAAGDIRIEGAVVDKSEGVAAGKPGVSGPGGRALVDQIPIDAVAALADGEGGCRAHGQGQRGATAQAAVDPAQFVGDGQRAAPAKAAILQRQRADLPHTAGQRGVQPGGGVAAHGGADCHIHQAARQESRVGDLRDPGLGRGENGGKVGTDGRKGHIDHVVEDMHRPGHTERTGAADAAAGHGETVDGLGAVQGDHRAKAHLHRVFYAGDNAATPRRGIGPRAAGAVGPDTFHPRRGQGRLGGMEQKSAK